MSEVQERGREEDYRVVKKGGGVFILADVSFLC